MFFKVQMNLRNFPEKTLLNFQIIFCLVSPQVEVYSRRFSTFEFPDTAVFKCDVLRLQCEALLMSNTVLDNAWAWYCNRNASHFSMAASGNSKVKNLLENLDWSSYKTKDSFFCYASDISCVQRAFWAQLVETVEVSFNSINAPISPPQGAKVMG